MSDPAGGREAELEAALTRIRDAMAGWVTGGVADMGPQEVHDLADAALRSSGSAAQNQEGITAVLPNDAPGIDVALLDDAIFALSHKRMQTGMERLARVRERLVERAVRSPQDEDHEEKS